MKNVRLCIDYICTSSINCLNCYFLEEKTDKIILLFENVLENIDLNSCSPIDIEKIVKSINEVCVNKEFKVVDKINYLVTSRNVFSFSDVFPKTSISRIRKYNKRDIEDSFPNFEKKNAYIETIHEDGNSGTIIFTTFCPLDIYDKLVLISKGMHLPLGSVTTSNYALTNRYEQYYKNDNATACIIYLDNSYSLINIYVNGVIVDNLLVEYGYSHINNEGSQKHTLQQIKSRVLAMIAKHEFSFEKLAITDIKVISNNNSASHILYDYLKDSTSFDIGFNTYYSLASTAYQNKFAFKKYKKSFFSKGFTLVEVVASVAIFSIVSLTAFTSIASMSSVPSKNNRTMSISNIISDISEIYQSSPIDFEAVYYRVNDVTLSSEVPANSTSFYYDASFKLQADESTYILTYEKGLDTLTINSFKEVNGSTNYIKNSVLIRG